MCACVSEKERETYTEKQTERHRKRHREKDGETDTGRKMERQTQGERWRDTDRQTDRHTFAQQNKSPFHIKRNMGHTRSGHKKMTEHNTAQRLVVLAHTTQHNALLF